MRRSLHQLYVDGVRAQRARGAVPVRLTQTAVGYTASSDTLAHWRHPSDAEFVYTSGEALWNIERNGLGQWTEPRCRIAAAEGTTIMMVQPCWDNSNKRVEFPDIPGRTVSMVGPGHLTNSGRATYIENAYELLDQPGEWYLDGAAHRVYYLPRKGENLARADVEAAQAEKLIDGQGTASAPVHDIAFRGLQFSYATWLTPSRPEGFSEIQAGYTPTPHVPGGGRRCRQAPTAAGVGTRASSYRSSRTRATSGAGPSTSASTSASAAPRAIRSGRKPGART